MWRNRFDFLFLLVDYLSHLLEPLVNSIQSKVSALSGRIFERASKPATFESTLANLSFEMNNLYSKHLNKVSDTNHNFKRKEDLLKNAQNTLKSMWPKCSIQLMGLDSVGCCLNWINCDICLVSGEINPKRRTAYKLSRNNETQVDEEEGGQENLKMKQIKGNPVDLNVLHSCDGTILFYVSGVDSGKEPTARQDTNKQKRTNSFCLAKFYSKQEFQLLELRSSLIFRYTQSHPELQCLYLIVSSLLERAKLIEPSGRLLANGFPTPPNQSTQVDSKSCSCCWLQQLHESIVNRHPDEQLIRYHLVLMLVAYLNTKEAHEITMEVKGRGQSEEALSLLLLGFLQAYSVHCSGIDNNQLSSSIQNSSNSNENKFVYHVREENGVLRLFYKNDGLKSTKNTQTSPFRSNIIIADPIENRDMTEVITNKCWARVSHLFSRLASKLNGQTDSGRPMNEHTSLLSSLFILSNELDEKRHEIPGLVNDWLQSARRYKDNNKSAPTQTKLTERSDRFKSIRQRKILTSLVCMLLFLFVRSLVQNYLRGRQEDLKHEAPDDLTHLKRQLFRDDLEYGRPDLINYFAKAEDIDRVEEVSTTTPGTIISAPSEDPVVDGGKNDNQVAESQPGEPDLEQQQQAQLMEALMQAMMSRMMAGSDMKPDELVGELLKNNKGALEGEENAEKMAKMSQILSGADGSGAEGLGMLMDLFREMKEDDAFEDFDMSKIDDYEFNFDTKGLKGEETYQEATRQPDEKQTKGDSKDEL